MQIRNFKKSMMGRSLLVGMTFLLGVSLVGCGTQSKTAATSSTASTPQITLKLSEAQPADYPDTIAEKAFAKQVEEKTKGRIKIDVYAGGQLGDEKTTIEQAQVGVIDIGRASAGPLTQYAKKMGVFSFPFLFINRDQMWKALDGDLGKDLFADMQQSNLVGLAFFEAGERSFYTKKPVKTIDDLKGMKIRVMQNDIMLDAFKQLGVSPTPISAAEVFNALQTGVIDGGENNVNTYVSDGHYEIAKNFTLSGHLRIPAVMFMSKKSWEKLSADDQKIIAQAAKDVQKVQLDEFDKYAQKAMDKVKAKGNQVITLSDADKKAFQDKMQPLYEKYKDQYGKLFDEIKAAK